MKAIMLGQVVHVEMRDYTTRDGRAAKSADVYLQASDPRFKPDRISVPEAIAPKVGDEFAAVCIFTARAGKYGPYLSVRAVELMTESDSASPRRPA